MVWGSQQQPLNILFMIMDDVGIDQMSSFGYGGKTPAAMPNIGAIASAGVRFHNHWGMPACSPSRAVFFEGRFPFRSHVLGALGPSDLANSMVSPYDYTVPKILKKKNYQSALFGKYHLGLQGENPKGIDMVSSLGFDHYVGWLDETGDPSSIDITAGGIGGSGGNGKSYYCGYVPGARNGGADAGACYSADGNCKILVSPADSLNPAGRQCRDQGGIFNPGAVCPAPGQAMPTNIKNAFTNPANLNSHFVSPLDVLENGATTSLPMTNPLARTYRGSLPIDAAISWVKKQNAKQPWMATVSFATDHTPLIQPPIDQLPTGSIDTNGFNCKSADINELKILSDQMITAMDHEVGRLLVELGLASQRPDGTLDYQPEKTNTMVVLVGDNGSLGGTVKHPFDPSRAKGTSYQTGVWVPLIVSGPGIAQPNRDVNHMTNHADMFALFGEFAGLNVSTIVPWQIDAKPMLPYLTKPNQPAIRTWNFNQNAPNLQANGTVNGPCLMGGGSTCSQIPVTQGVCNDNGGEWWGTGANGSEGTGPVTVEYCCQVVNYLAQHGTAESDLPSILPLGSVGIRNRNYKLVQNDINAYAPSSTSPLKTADNCLTVRTHELYRINENVPLPKIDYANQALLDQTTSGDQKVDLSSLNSEQKRQYLTLSRKLNQTLASQPDCPGDGNLDNVVNLEDVAQWATFSVIDGGEISSWYDFNLDGKTNTEDFQIIKANFGKHCKAPPPPR